ncbi:unnamed protein product [Haemonchus placei]|uniref:Mss4-like protein n=1 Tax=Haemonchus placei TaxID=6290 RepID=A0A0N4W5E2_HAEPC|nr:unnamed protein product [Haemonchus placei]
MAVKGIVEQTQVNRDDLLNVDDKNWKSVLCRRCDSIIFPEDRVKLVDSKFYAFTGKATQMRTLIRFNVSGKMTQYLSPLSFHDMPTSKRSKEIVIPYHLTVKLPLMSTSGTGCKETEDVSLWWYTASDMDFDTIGFAFEVYDNKKVLLCGDCEFGPIGLRSQDDKQFWVATERVVHVDKPPPPGAKPRPKKEKKKK